MSTELSIVNCTVREEERERERVNEKKVKREEKQCAPLG